MDAAHTIFTVAKRRCYVNIPAVDDPNKTSERLAMEAEQDAEWEVLDEIEGVRKGKVHGEGGRPQWLPKDISPVLEEPPKLGLLAEVLYEIEKEIMDKPGSNCAYALILGSCHLNRRVTSATRVGHCARYDFFKPKLLFITGILGHVGLGCAKG